MAHARRFMPEYSGTTTRTFLQSLVPTRRATPPINVGQARDTAALKPSLSSWSGRNVVGKPMGTISVPFTIEIATILEFVFNRTMRREHNKRQRLSGKDTAGSREEEVVNLPEGRSGKGAASSVGWVEGGGRRGRVRVKEGKDPAFYNSEFS